jgi:type III restriction enzyme
VKSWKECLSQAADKRKHLAALAQKNFTASGKLIRPIVLVQVERTGKDQREAGLVHSEDAKEYLMQNLGVPETAIAIKTSQRDDIEGRDLLDDGCPVEWIITKAALQEGWDCPFAYILVSLNNTQSQRTMTQLVGRVLRQPFITRTTFDELNESYIYCLKSKASEIAKEVKKALEKEGYEGHATSVIDRSSGLRQSSKREASVRELFKNHYREFEGKIYLPRFCVQNGERDYEKLDWFRHLLAEVDVRAFDFGGIDWDLTVDLAAAKDYFYRVELGSGPEKISELESVCLQSDDSVRNWMIANLPFDYYGFRERSDIVSGVFERLRSDLAGRFNLIKYALRERISGFVERETDRASEAAFRKLFNSKRLCFYLECVECVFEIPQKVEVRAMQPLTHDNGDFVQRSLFDFVPNDLNGYERSVALYLDRHPQVLWWYRNLVGSANFAVQGYRRNLIYPDFVVQEGIADKPEARVLVLESKGEHLKGNEDTNYKRSVAELFEEVGKSIPWQRLAEEFENDQFRFQILDEGDYGDKSWRDELERLLQMTRE